MILIDKMNTFNYFNDHNRLRDMTDKIINLHSNLISSTSLFVDLYSLRRFLDKDYITNVVQYNGVRHTMNMIYILMHDFGFKLTHSTVEGLTHEKALKAIKVSKIDNLGRLYEAVLPKHFSQCVDMSVFPKWFN